LAPEEAVVATDTVSATPTTTTELPLVVRGDQTALTADL
jgi:hypothetical protein